MSGQATAALWRNFRVYQVFGANTDVGKTILSTLLCRTAKKSRKDENAWYLKPVSTGALSDADRGHLQRHAPGVTTQNFYQFDDPVSPHIAAGKTQVEDADLLQKLMQQIKSNAEGGPGFMIVESAGGPHSPAPSGTSQAELLRPIRLPTLLVADYRLGGISTSISSFEALRMRGFDIEGVAVCKDDRYQNHLYLRDYFEKHNIPLLTFPVPPPQMDNEDASVMQDFYQSAEEGDGQSLTIREFDNELHDRHGRRIDRLGSLATTAFKHVWWPFQQHQLMQPEKLNVIDSAYGDYFQTLAQGNLPTKVENILQSTVDGSASWWTQGLGHSNQRLAATAAYAAGRYGHVMFAEGVHEPALALTERLLAVLGNPRLQRVFFSDNGSTGMEVGVKMALKAASARYDWKDEDPVEIIGLNNSYHGDTIGAMDLSEPSVYNKKVNWYKGRGFWFDSPSVQMQNGTWTISKPESAGGKLGASNTFESFAAVFDTARDGGEDAATYERYIRGELERLTQQEKRRFGALVMEPVVLGAGGMMLVDPLFQRTLVKVVRCSEALFSLGHSGSQAETQAVSDEWQGLPVVMDEVFTGLYRLGHNSASSMLHVQPDISVHAKLLTGGLVPLACTVASESVFRASLSSQKVDALLHGHSYTAHPIGCAVAIESLKQLAEQDTEGHWDAFKSDWAGSKSIGAELLGAVRDVAKGITAAGSGSGGGEEVGVWSVWSQEFVSALSKARGRVDGVWALGSVLSISLHDDAGAGYTSDVARSVQQRLLQDPTGEGWNVHARVLGNVLYLMTSQVTRESEVRAWERRVREVMQI